MLYIVNEMTFNGYSINSLDLLYIIAILLSILVIIGKNPIVSVLFLIGLYLTIFALLAFYLSIRQPKSILLSKITISRLYYLAQLIREQKKKELLKNLVGVFKIMCNIKHLRLSVLSIFFLIIIYKLELSVLYSFILVLFFTIILYVFPIIMKDWNHYPETLVLVGFSAVICVTTLIKLAMTPEFHVNCDDLSEINIFLLYIGIARMIIDISFTKNEISYFDKIKKIVNEYWRYFKKNPWFCISIAIPVFLLVTISINLYCSYLGVTLCKKNYFTFYIFLLTKVILVNSTISLIMLTVTPSKNWYDVIGMSIWLPFVLIPYSVFYYFFILPVLIEMKSALIELIQIRLTKFEQSWYEFKLAIISIVDNIKIILSPLKEWRFYLEPLFFLRIKNIGELLISMHNRPAQLGRFLVQCANWGLVTKVNSLSRKQFISNYTQKEWGNLWSNIRYNLERNKDSIRHWNHVKSKPRFLPVVLPLPVMNRGSYSNLSPGSLKYLFTSVYFYIKSDLNLIKLYNTMKTLGSNSYYLPLTIEGCTVGVNLSSTSLDFQLSCEGKEFKIAFGAENIAKNFSLYNEGLHKDILNPISHKERLLYLTDPGRLGYNTQVFMQRGIYDYQPNFTQDEYSIVSGTDEPSNSNSGTQRAFGDIGNSGAEIGSKGIKVKAEQDVNGSWKVNLKFDTNKLYPFWEYTNTDWKNYLLEICIAVRTAFAEAAGENTAEYATISNIFIDMPEESDPKFDLVLHRAIEMAMTTGNKDIAMSMATGNKDIAMAMAIGNYYIELEKVYLASQFFIDFLCQLEDDEVRGTSYAEPSEGENSEGENSEGGDTTQTREESNNPFNVPLDNDEIESLIEDLTTRKLCLNGTSGINTLKKIGLYADRSSKMVLEVINGKEEIHSLLTRFYSTNKELFKNGKNINFSQTSIKKVIDNLQNLKLSNI